ncbi:MAG TPA: hypothetical protein VHR45_06630 [Thermoanaerobaculia bacterium]|nr:hypothetical protein [Thermoanaerobaculia bacterium]
MRLLSRSASGLVLFLLAGAAEAQFNQYTTPGGPEGHPVDRKAQLAKEVADARFRLGAVRLSPVFALTDVQYVKNLAGTSGSGTSGTTPSDFTATASAGLRAYLPSGPALTWTASGLPEYVWWQRESARRRLNGRYRAGLFGFWNRLTLETLAGSDALQQILSPEALRLTSARTDHFETTAELRLSRAISTFVAGTLERTRSLASRAADPQAVELKDLDRDERVVRAGLRWHAPGDWTIGAAAERSDVDFARRGPGSLDRSNSGTAPVLELQREHGHLFLQADVAQRSLAPKRGASFLHFNKTTGHATIAVTLARSAEIFVYGNRNLVYSLLAADSYLTDQRQGAALHLKLGRFAQASLFGESGTLDYTVILPGTPHRKDDLTSFGGALSFTLFRGAALRLQGSRTRFTSNLPGASRSLTLLGTTVTFAGGQL